MPKLTIEEVAEIRNALQVIQGNAELILGDIYIPKEKITEDIVKQVKRIDKLLPKRTNK